MNEHTELARALAKREHGESYEGFELSHKELASYCLDVLRGVEEKKSDRSVIMRCSRIDKVFVTVEQMADAFVEMDDQHQADFFEHVNRNMEKFCGSPQAAEKQWCYLSGCLSMDGFEVIDTICQFYERRRSQNKIPRKDEP